MNCNDLQENLAIYADDVLSPEIRRVCDEHLRECPLCRAEFAELLKVQNGLQSLRQVNMPNNLVSSVRRAVAVEIAASRREPRLSFTEKLENYSRSWLAPYSVGALASSLLFVLSFIGLWSSMNAFRDFKTAQNRADRNQAEILLASNSSKNNALPPLLTAEEYSALRMNYSAESPSLNPGSSFVAMTASMKNGALSDDSIVIVADVFADGLAKVSQVIRASRDRRTMRELEKSLQIEPAFVTAKMDNRPETVRVVYLIQKVDVR